MADIRVPRNSWVVVCDGGKALIMQNDGDVTGVDLKVRETLAQPNEPDREIGTDKPGRAHGADGTSGSAVEELSWHDQAEAEFLKRIAFKLDDLIIENDATNIVLVAPPRALGTLRANMSVEAQAIISAEIPKDYTNMPIDQIERRLAA
ncbi:host attachment family protein [Rhizobium sp. AN80A]|uniref:host attachment family protein n=1 Tax=Rhizobium sp. AN80A TaxID=3040673 RepID=UPI0024B3205B|nr:host attachment family protein [Rhizobium sp. AN80A]